MSLKAELELWATALVAYDADDFEKSLEVFSVSSVDFILIFWGGSDQATDRP